MILLELTAAIVEPILADASPEPRELRKIPLQTPFAIRNATD
jgi:hypothetical protein